MIKKIIFSTILIIFNYLVIEAISYGFHLFKYKNYDLAEIQKTKHAAIDAVNQGTVYTAGDEYSEKAILKKIIHPYVGYTIDGKIKSDDCVSESPQDCYTRIRVDTDKPFPKRSDDKLIVAVFGGSFSLGTVNTGNVDFYKLWLGRIPQYQDKEIIVMSFAGGGYKQPQQVMSLNYLYGLGAEFDIVINIDGFNEMAIPHYGHRQGGVHPSFPQSWSAYMQSALSVELLDAYASKKVLVEKQASFAKFSSIPGFRHSPTLNIIWRIKNDNALLEINELSSEIQTSNSSENRDFRYQEVGPDYEFTDWPNFYRYSANIWAKSSVLMKAATEINGGQYFHFMQPNQHIEGAKILSDEERRIAYDPSLGYGRVFKESHQYLVEKFDYLEENEVAFFDLTYHFQDTPDTLYIDTCCHMNYKGYGFVVAEVVARITPYLSKQ
ncbi:MAG: hypothetical protein KTR16_16355 [Acidiferrobacterales bacterium]|nr:hypothetical protein [Acidiferrobacterales bacterium]